jgi:hypothetical protein
MMLIVIYGDDNNLGWPVFMNSRLLYPEHATNVNEDFVHFFSTIFGMINKESESFVFDSYYSVHKFKTIGENLWREVSYIPGPSFIKNSPSLTYVDDILMGVFPYQDTFHIISKLRGMSATQGIGTCLCLISSLSRLCSGNLEAYSMLKIAYYYFVDKYGLPSKTDWEEFSHMKNGRSLGSLIKHGFDENLFNKFPEMSYLWALQNNGYTSGSAYNYKVNGVPMDMTPVHLDTYDQPLLSLWDDHSQYWDFGAIV